MNADWTSGSHEAAPYVPVTVPMNAPAGAPTLAGWLDKATPDGVAGWAADVQRPDRAVMLAFYLNGEKVTVATCETPRSDAVAAGFPGARSFAVNLQGWLKDGSNALEVRAEPSGAVLPNGRQWVNAGRAGEIGGYWSAQYSTASRLTTRWWESDYIVKRINRRVCGESIGCGTGSKERNVIRSGLVEHFTLFELSSVAIEQGRAQAAQAGLAQNMTFRMEDGLTAETGDGVYDLVYWNNALHHMFDVKAALQ